MEQKLNIAKILRNKPRGTKLYSMIHGKCSSEAVTDEIFKINFCTSKFGLTQSGECTLIKFGNMYDGGECIIFPSKEMRDWKKFSWKKGDVLVSREGSKILFDKWANEDYTKFLGKIKVLGNSHCYDTANYSLASKEEALEFIKSVEEINNGKLNLETLEIEKQLELRDGDIVVTDAVPSMCYSKCIFILKGDWNIYEDRVNSYIFYNVYNNHISFNIVDKAIRDRDIHLATEEEKQQLFDALAKEGKRWNTEKKQIVNLKEYQFKPFDKVLVRDDYKDEWRASFFSHIREGLSRYVTTGLVWKFCIPYEGNEHLLGTTNNVED